MNHRIAFTLICLVLLLFTDSVADAGVSKKQKGGDHDSSKDVVYVCACMKDKSCSCMTEAKMEGPCACGTQGGPPMKAVAADSDWAKENREALAK
jgi:hypothetical protein